MRLKLERRGDKASFDERSPEQRKDFDEGNSLPKTGPRSAQPVRKERDLHIEFQLPRRRQPLFACFKGVLRLFIRKVRVIFLEPELRKKTCLYLANHANKTGPLIYEMFLPVYHVKWGAHEMLGNYDSRRAYLRDVLYIRKNRVPRRKAAAKALFEGVFSKYIYRGMKVLPTYPDGRLIRTVKKSVELLKNGLSLMIYPENSNTGYHDVLVELFAGFSLVMEQYRKSTGKDIPVCPVYYHRRKRLIVVGKAHTLAEYEGLRRKELAEVFRKLINDLFYRIERGEFDGSGTN